MSLFLFAAAAIANGSPLLDKTLSCELSSGTEILINEYGEPYGQTRTSFSQVQRDSFAYEISFFNRGDTTVLEIRNVGKADVFGLSGYHSVRSGDKSDLYDAYYVREKSLLISHFHSDGLISVHFEAPFDRGFTVEEDISLSPAPFKDWSDLNLSCRPKS